MLGLPGRGGMGRGGGSWAGGGPTGAPELAKTVLEADFLSAMIEALLRASSFMAVTGGSGGSRSLLVSSFWSLLVSGFWSLPVSGFFLFSPTLGLAEVPGLLSKIWSKKEKKYHGVD